MQTNGFLVETIRSIFPKYYLNLSYLLFLLCGFILRKKSKKKNKTSWVSNYYLFLKVLSVNILNPKSSNPNRHVQGLELSFFFKLELLLRTNMQSYCKRKRRLTSDKKGVSSCPSGDRALSSSCSCIKVNNARIIN